MLLVINNLRDIPMIFFYSYNSKYFHIKSIFLLVTIY
jgi:hypothetical protein